MKVDIDTTVRDFAGRDQVCVVCTAVLTDLGRISLEGVTVIDGDLEIELTEAQLAELEVILYDEAQDIIEESNCGSAMDEDYELGFDFSDPSGRSALFRATEDDLRDLPCPACGRENSLTRRDREAGHQCDLCADADEGW